MGLLLSRKGFLLWQTRGGYCTRTSRSRLEMPCSQASSSKCWNQTQARVRFYVQLSRYKETPQASCVPSELSSIQFCRNLEPKAMDVEYKLPPYRRDGWPALVTCIVRYQTQKWACLARQGGPQGSHKASNPYPVMRLRR